MGEIARPEYPHRHWRFSSPNYDTLLPPGPLAERLEPHVALAGMRHCMTLKKAEGHFHSAWRHVEYAMNQQVDELTDELRRKYIDDAQYLLGDIINRRNRRIGPDLYAQAMTLGIYLPVFTKRALRQPITPEDCRDIHQSFGRLFDDILHDNTADTSYKPARVAELLGLDLSARPGLSETLLYIASPREEASRHQHLNHDEYFIRNEQKLPLQTKLIQTEKIYNAPTNVIVMEPIARHALERAGCIDPDEKLALGDTSLILAEFVTRETVYQDISPQERSALDYATRSIAGRYRFCYPQELSA
jgi:hypothetical protein